MRAARPGRPSHLDWSRSVQCSPFSTPTRGHMEASFGALEWDCSAATPNTDCHGIAPASCDQGMHPSRADLYPGNGFERYLEAFLHGAPYGPNVWDRDEG